MALKADEAHEGQRVIGDAEPTRKLERLFGQGPTAVLQTLVFTLYALFFNFQKFNKAVAIAFVAVITLMIKPQIMQNAIRVALGLVYWSYRQVRRLVLLILGPFLGTATESARPKEIKLLAQVRLVSPIEQHLQKAAYVLIVTSWTVIAWSLLVLSMQIREIVGKEAEMEVVAMWATMLAVETFGTEALKLIVLKFTVEFLMGQAQAKFLDISPAVLWHEHYIIKLSNTVDQEKDVTGEQDMGDDADADGGQDFSALDDDGGDQADMDMSM
eukprot:gene5853-7054_t